MVNGWGPRIGIAVAVFIAVTLLTVIPSVFVAATISCWGVEVKDSLDPARYCGFGGLTGLVVAPALGLIAAALYVLYDNKRHRQKASSHAAESHGD